jgi:hypothetical protein
MPKVPSVLPPEMAGVMHITGYRGIGKSYLAAQADAPQNIAFFDFESKGKSIDSQLEFGLYRALTQESKEPSGLFDVATLAFNGLKQDRYTVAVLDNTYWLELALQAGARRDVRHYCEEYGLNYKNVVANRFGGLRSVVNMMISDNVCGVLHNKGVRLIINTSHIKQRWGSGGPIPGKYRIKGADRWQELSILSLILFGAEHAPIPSALVQKEQLGLLEWSAEKGEHVIKRRLPFRIPRCTFAEIRRYLKEPADLKHPASGEMPAEEESAPFEERLSREQIALMKLMLEKEQREERAADATVELLESKTILEVDPVVSEIMALANDEEEPRNPAEIARIVGRPLNQVIGVLKSQQG